MDAQALAEQAKLIYGKGDFVEASQAFAGAAEAFLQAGDRLMMAEMKNNQSVALLRGGETQAALEAVDGTEAIFGEAGDQRRLGMAHANRASALEAMKRGPEAVEAYRSAAEALEKAGEDQMRLQVLQLLSSHHMRRGKFMDAIMALQSGLAGLKNPSGKQRFMKKLLSIRL